MSTKQTRVRRRLVAETEKLWCEAAKRKYGNRCEICGKTENLQCHHFIPKSRSLALRFEVSNAVILCFSHHHRFHTTGDPRIVCAIIEARGKGWKDDLFKKSNKTRSSFYTFKWIREQKEMLLKKFNGKV